MQDSLAGVFRLAGVVFDDFVPLVLDDPGDISSNSPGAPRATSAASPSKPLDKPDRKLFSVDDSLGDVVAGKRLDCKLVVEGEKGQGKTLADNKDSTDLSSGVSGRESTVFVPSGSVAAAAPLTRLWLKKDVIDYALTVVLRNHQIFKRELR